MTTPGYPLIAWGDAADLSASPWLNRVGTVTVTGSQADPFGGTDAYLLADDDAVAREQWGRTVAVGSETATLALFLKAGTAATNQVLLYDATAASVKITVQVAWSGGVATASKLTGTGTVLSAVAVGNDWYMVRAVVPGLTPSNTHEFRIAPEGTATLTGGVYVYMRNAVTLNPLDAMLGYAGEREGHRKVRAPSGVYDVWDGGTDYYLDAVARFVPAYDTADPNVSGWYGTNPIAGVNCGVQAMLTAGRKGYDLIYCPDRADASDSITSELVEPMEGGVELAPNGQRHVTFTLRNTSSEYPAYDT